MKARARRVLIPGICAACVLAGAVAELVIIPRVLPRSPQALNNSAPAVTRQQLDEMLARVAGQLDSGLRARLSEAIFSESERAGYDPLFVLALVAVESRFRITVSSERGAYGLMQLKPSTFAWIAGREPDLDDDGAV